MSNLPSCLVITEKQITSDIFFLGTFLIAKVQAINVTTLFREENSRDQTFRATLFREENSRDQTFRATLFREENSRDQTFRATLFREENSRDQTFRATLFDISNLPSCSVITEKQITSDFFFLDTFLIAKVQAINVIFLTVSLTTVEVAKARSDLFYI
jgi:hypothetical protein